MDKFQNLINRINAKQDFTYNLTPNKSRYIVSIKSVYNGLNPSIENNMRVKISNIVDAKNHSFDSLGGWFNESTKIYTLDLNLHLADINTALKLARVNNQLAIYDSLENNVIYLNNI